MLSLLHFLLISFLSYKLKAMAPTCTFIVLILFLISPAISVFHASDSIISNQSLSGDQKLVSNGGNFALGFFTKDESYSKFYIGIWYNKVSQLTPVWVANRATPVPDTTKSLFHISPDGNLALLDESKSLVWSTNSTISSNSSTVAVLLDNGNLVLRDADNPSIIFWQSIDNPTHTWLSGGKITLNKITGVSQRLISWKNSEDPAPGLFSLGITKDGQYQSQWNMSKSYWTTGVWDGRAFTKVPEMTSGYMCDYTYVNNSEENYFSYTLKDNSTIARLIMDVKGQMKMLVWAEIAQQWIQFWSEPEAQCEVTAFCGPFSTCNEQMLQKCSCVKGFKQKSPKDWDLGDYSGGCVRNKRLQCGVNNNSASSSSQQDKFFQMPSVRLPDLGQALQVGSDDECMLACLNNCSCTAYSYGSGCTVWHGDLLNLQDQYEGLDGGTLYLRLAASELPSHHQNRSVSGFVAGGVAAVVVVAGVVIFILYVTIRRSRKIAFRLVNGALVVFRYSDLQCVTKNFAHKLGSGSFGSVFKGVLPDSTAIAVKKLEGLRQGEKQFRAEVSTLGTIQHVNLVPLRGFCVEDTKRLLVFDYMPNGSLDSHLFGRNDNVLDWPTRYQIALGIARGLDYLHEKCRDCIIHCDIKPENILLDAELNPKVADFGLAKLLGREFSHVLTSMRGTIGYLAPEWITGLAITPKADVYSFGMMLLEIISGKRNTKPLAESGDNYFPLEAAMRVREDMAHCLLDERLKGNANMEEVDTICRVACWCIQDMEHQRPTMGLIVQMLERLVEVRIPPISAFLQGLVIGSEGQNYNSEILESC